MKSYPLQDYVNAGCTLIPALPGIADAVWKETNGKMCPGCWAYRDGNCAGYRKLTSGRAVLQKQYAETVREEATRRGVSISQVRRERQGAANG